MICESNSLRTVVEPGIFLFLNNQPRRMKPSAQEVVHSADLILTNAKDPLPEIQINKNGCLSLISEERSTV